MILVAGSSSMGSEHLCRKTEVREIYSHVGPTMLGHCHCICDYLETCTLVLWNKGFHRVMIFLQEALITKFCWKALKCNQRRVQPVQIHVCNCHAWTVGMRKNISVSRVMSSHAV
jgi:hypothetical protein